MNNFNPKLFFFRSMISRKCDVIKSDVEKQIAKLKADIVAYELDFSIKLLASKIEIEKIY